MGNLARRAASLLVALLVITLTAMSTGWARADSGGDAPVPGEISGTSPDGQGSWTVHYERVAGGDPDVSAAINEHIDDEANRMVQEATWNGSTRRPWTFDAVGTMQIRPITVSEVFVASYSVDEPNMPMQSVSTVVCDRRSGIPITLDNLFSDRQAGLTRLSEHTQASLSAVQPPNVIRDWRRNGLFAPIRMNYKNWIPTPEGIEVHFPEFQFGRGLKAVTVPWSAVADVIAPEFAPISN